MKVLIINGCPRPNGNTAVALREMETIFKAEGIETEIVQVGNKAIRGCIACSKCAETGKCVFDTAVYSYSQSYYCLLFLKILQNRQSHTPRTSITGIEHGLCISFCRLSFQL